MSAFFIMPKRKTHKPRNISTDCNPVCDTPVQSRRSIPVAEVNEIIQREVARVKAEATIYDDRARILEQLESNEGEIAYLESRLHGVRLQNKTIRNDLTQVNLAITRQLELDGV